MKRLIEDPKQGEALAELVRSAEPYRPNPFSKRLVHARLERSSAQGARSRRRFALMASAGVLGVSAVAFAAYEALRAPEPAAPVASQPAVIAPPASVAEVAPVVPAPSIVRSEPPAARSGAPLPASPESSAGRAVAARPPPRAGEDPAAVLEAVRALRREGDPARAQQLLDRYLADNPKGALREDALALAMEAAAARQDPRAADYARRYLARYPAGRFRSVAERLLARSSRAP